MIKFVLGQYRDNSADLDEVWDEDEWQLYEDLPIMFWEHVAVDTQEDMDAYIHAKKKYLEAAWAPNQSWDEGVENQAIMAEAEATMKRLRRN